MSLSRGGHRFIYEEVTKDCYSVVAEDVVVDGRLHNYLENFFVSSFF